MFESNPAEHAALEAELHRPSLYVEFLRHIAHRGHDVPDELLERDVTKAHVYSEQLVPVFQRIFEARGHPEGDDHWRAYETCEELVDLEDNFQFRRFRHLRTVTRMIGEKPGTGGSSGFGFLRRALDLTFFPELYAVRTRVGR